MKVTAYTNAVVLNGTKDMVPQPGCTVVVEDGKITAVGPDAVIPEGAGIVDLKGAYLLPGLINLHAHLPGTGKPMKFSGGGNNKIEKLKKIPLAVAVMKKLTYSDALAELNGGVTTVRGVGGVLTCDTEVRDAINAGKKIGPRILAANEAIAPPHGHMAGTVATVVNTPEEAVKLVDTIAKQKPDLIKLMITGGVLDAEDVGEPPMRMKPEMVKACCDRAHELGFMVAAHVESTEGVKVALENGVDTIEHGATLSPELIDLFKERNAALICTLSPCVPLMYLGDEVLKEPRYTRNTEIVFEGIARAAEAARQNGIKLGLGNDVGCPYITHYDFWRELVYFTRWTGADAKEAIYTATLANAAIVGIDKETGSVEPGKSADLLVVRDNPLEDIKALGKPELVVIRGRELAHPVNKTPQGTRDILDDVFKRATPERVKLDIETF